MKLTWVENTDPNDKEKRRAWYLTVEPAAKLLTLYKLRNANYYCSCLGLEMKFLTTDFDEAKLCAIRWFAVIAAALNESVQRELKLLES